MKIAIVGTAPSSRRDAPYNSDWKIWSLGGNFKDISSWDRWFELHSPDVLKSANIPDEMWRFLERAGDKLYTGFYHKNLPSAQRYPIDSITQKYGRYFTSSIAYMIALAIDEGATDIGLWGVDMAAEDEYSHQRSCCEHYLGIARGAGINVSVAKESPLLRAERMYAFEYDNLSSELLVRQHELERAVTEKERDKEQYYYLKGKLDQIKQIGLLWG